MSPTLPVLGALVVIMGLATAAVMMTSGEGALERLGLLIGLMTPSVIGLSSLLKANEAAKNTDSGSRLLRSLNGGLEGRMKAAVRDVRDEPDDSVTPEGDRAVPEYYGTHSDVEPHG